MDITSLPKDGAMLLSYVNTKLRDEYASLDDLCAALDIDKNALVSKLKDSGFEYNPEQNKFW